MEYATNSHDLNCESTQRTRAYNISINFKNSPSLQHRIEVTQGDVQYSRQTSITQQCGRLACNYSDHSWIPSVGYNQQSNC